jgi:hypothetical protein
MIVPSSTIVEGFTHYFRDFARRARALSEGLSEEQFWTKPFPYGNSVGHLVLHLAGNLNYYIGARIASTGYVRDREREFAESNPPSKDEALQRLDEAVSIVIATLEKQTEGDWPAAYSGIGVDDVQDRFGIFLRCAVHFHHHVGQMIYLAEEHARQRSESKL